MKFLEHKMPTPQIQNDPIINLPSLYKYGLVLSNNASTPNTVLDISSGMCRDSNNVIDIELGTANVENESPIPAPLQLNIEINGLNGLDVGTIENTTMYAVYMIADSRYYKPTGAIMTLASNDVPLLPFGYDSYRLIGFWPVDGSGHLEAGFYQGIANDMIFWYAGTDREILINGNATVQSGVDLSSVIPPLDNTIVTFMTSFNGAAASQFFQLYAPTNSVADYFQYCQVAGVLICGQATVVSRLVVGAPTVNYLVNNAGAALSMWINSFEVSI